MKSREAVISALKKRKVLVSNSTGLYYRNIKGVLHSNRSNAPQLHPSWLPSQLDFKMPESWENMELAK